MSIFSHFQERFEATRQGTFLQEYLDPASKTRQPMPCRRAPADGDRRAGIKRDTRWTPRLSRIFQQGDSLPGVRRLPRHGGMHRPDRRVLSAMRQGLEEKKQILTCSSARSAAVNSPGGKLKQLDGEGTLHAIKARWSSSRRWACSTLTKTAPSPRRTTEPRGATYARSCRPANQAPQRVRRRHRRPSGQAVPLDPSIQIAIAKTEPGDEK